MNHQSAAEPQRRDPAPHLHSLNDNLQRLRLPPSASTTASPLALPLRHSLPVLMRSLASSLTVNEPGDPFEQEADRVADQVMRMPEPINVQRKCAACEQEDKLQRKCASREEEEERNALQSKETGAGLAVAPPIVHEVLSSPGQPLDADTRAFMEPRFGHEFRSVRVHTDERAAEAAGAVSARAYTVGNHIAFADGQFAPHATNGRRLLAHELAHVIQQGTSKHAEEVLGPATFARREPVTAAEHAPSAVAHPLNLSRTGLSVSLAPQTGGAAGAHKVDLIGEARAAALLRVLKARDRVAGVGPPAPPDPLDPKKSLPDIEAYENQQKARRYASLFFEWPDPNMDQVHDILEHMLTALSPGFPTKHASSGDPECKGRSGYVVDQKPPIVLCPRFFSSSPEDRIRTMVHESAHVAGIGQASAEGYCAVFDYAGPCPGGFAAADSWAQFVNAVADQAPDAPPTSIIIKRKAPGTKSPSSGGKKP